MSRICIVLQRNVKVEGCAGCIVDNRVNDRLAENGKPTKISRHCKPYYCRFYTGIIKDRPALELSRMNYSVSKREEEEEEEKERRKNHSFAYTRFLPPRLFSLVRKRTMLQPSICNSSSGGRISIRNMYLRERSRIGIK